MASKTKVDKQVDIRRKESWDRCDMGCPYLIKPLKYTGYLECDLYGENLIEEIDYNNPNASPVQSCNQCSNNLPPRGNVVLLKLVKENNKMLKELLNRR